MTHLARTLAVFLSTAAAAIVIALGDPNVQHELEHHTAAASLIAALAGVFYAIARATTKSLPGTTPN